MQLSQCIQLIHRLACVTLLTVIAAEAHSADLEHGLFQAVKN